MFADAYDVGEAGDSEGAPSSIAWENPVLRRAADEKALAPCGHKLLGHRARRIRPGSDDEVLADSNG